MSTLIVVKLRAVHQWHVAQQQPISVQHHHGPIGTNRMKCTFSVSLIWVPTNQPTNDVNAIGKNEKN
ncbi:hypothetical protein BLOT_009901 [Blomia tropicalis]|nr:hypothetical protein BLOT_009901 [Blomia tropicalis]